MLFPKFVRELSKVFSFVFAQRGIEEYIAFQNFVRDRGYHETALRGGGPRSGM